MKLTILGSGVCASHFCPTDSLRHSPGYLLEVDGQHMLFDCSEGIRFRIEEAGVNYASIAHVALTHSHPDHNSIFHFIQSQLGKGLWGGEKFMPGTLNVYCPDQILNDWDKVWNFYYPDFANDRFAYPKVDVKAMTAPERSTTKLPFGSLHSQRVLHGRNDAVDALAFRFECAHGTVVYSGDTRDCSEIRKIAEGADLFLCEASASVGGEEAGRKSGHLTPRQSGTVAKDAGVKKLILTHYTGLNSEAEMLEDCRKSGFKGDITVAHDFDAFEYKR